MKVILLAQGNELTTGQTVDTNSNWLAERLFPLGLEVHRVVTVPDELDQLIEVLLDASGRVPLVLSTGGLGPTRDDLTAEAVSRAFSMPLALNEEAMAQVEARYRAFNRVMPEVNRKQAVLPVGAEVVENRWGTAPAFSVKVHGCRMYFMPGVPREMKALMDNTILPAILREFSLVAPIQKIVRVVGVGESDLEMCLADLEVPGMQIGFRTRMPENQIKLRFHPATPAQTVDDAVAEVRRRVGWRAFGVDSGDLAEVVGNMLAERGHTVALAESCTAGRTAAWLGEIAGASRYLIEGAVVYSNAAKVRCCGVSEATLAEYGAVSEPVARQLAEGIRERAGTTWGIGVTGIAGPGGGSAEKPVGTVHFAVSGPDGTEHLQVRLPGDRNRIQIFAAATALLALYRRLLADVDPANVG